MTTGRRLFCKEILCFNTMPCRHMPLLVHFWSEAFACKDISDFCSNVGISVCSHMHTPVWIETWISLSLSLFFSLSSARVPGPVRRWAHRNARQAYLRPAPVSFRHWLNWYLAQRVPSLFLSSSSRKCLVYDVLGCMFPWMARYPLS